MMTKRFLIALGLGLGISGTALAIEAPGHDATTEAGWISDVARISAIKARNGTSAGNPANTDYWFYATTLASPNTATTSSDFDLSDTVGDRVRAATAVQSTSGNQTEIVSKFINNLRAGTSYAIYAQACPQGAPYNSATCSIWVKLRPANISTLPLPSDVFATPVNTDMTPSSLGIRLNVNNVGNVTDVENAKITIRDVTGGNTDTLIVPSLSPVAASMLLDGSAVTDPSFGTYSFLPNNQYRMLGQLKYPYAGQFTAVENEGPFWTDPVKPGPSNVPNGTITHCSAVINVQNSVGNPVNPGYTNYQVCLNNGAGCKTSADINGTGLPTDTVSVTFNNLTDGVTYGGTSQAINEGGSSWNNSVTNTVPNFTTVAWGGNFTVDTITNTSAIFHVNALNSAGVTSWQILGVPNAPSGVGAPPAAINLVGLAPNTQYNVQIQLNEGSTCSSAQPATPITFYTVPFAPTTPAALSNVVATSLTASWSDPSANPDTNTHYVVQLCLNACNTATTNGCAGPNLVSSANPAKSGASGSANFGSLTPVTPYCAQVKTQSVSLNASLDSSWLVIGSTTTPPNQSSITIAPNPGSAITGNPTVFTAHVFDQQGNEIANQAVNWSYNGAGTVTANGHQTTLTASAVGTFTLTASLAGFPNGTDQITVTAAGPVISVQPTLTITGPKTGVLSCTATDNAFASNTLIYEWAKEDGPGAVSFSDSGSNSAQISTVTFSSPTPGTTAAGTYRFRCTVTDPASIKSFAVTSPTNLPQALTLITVSPNNFTININDAPKFTAAGTDQFGAPMALGTVTWTSSSGNMSGTGGSSVFNTTGKVGKGIRITATDSVTGKTGFASGDIVNFDVSVAYGYPVPFKSTSGMPGVCFTNLGTDAKIRIYTTTGREVFKTEVVNAPDPGTQKCQYTWDTKNSSGEKVASGVYLYVIESPTTTKHGKLIIIQ